MNAERTCDDVRADLSARLDGDRDVDGDRLDQHLARCAACRSFEDGARALRQQLRYESVGFVPDVTSTVTARLAAPAEAERRPPGRRLLAVAAAFVIGALVGAVLVSDRGTEPGPAAAADVPDRIDAAQYQLVGLDAEVTLVEHGWNAEVPERRWTGRLAWDAPESLSLELRDRTDYPSPEWVPDDVSLVVDGGRRATSGPRDCPAEAQPLCTPTDPRREVTTGREPFADDAPVPLDLVLPVTSFAGAADPAPLAPRTVAGRPATGLTTTAAQVGPMLDGLRPSGNLREVHPADPVELWLDTETMAPLALVVRAGDVPGRTTWATNRGYVDEVGEPILELRVDAVRYGRTEPDLDLVTDAGAGAARQAGFTDGPVPTLLTAAEVPLGFAPYRTGTLTGDGPAVDVATWTDGRAWIKVRSTADWSGGRLFGGLGRFIRPATLASGGVAYVSDRGDRVAVHTPFLDVVVSGSVDEAMLLSVAASLGLTGEPVPSDWDEAATATRADAVAARPGLLLPQDLAGFAPPAFRIDGDTVVTRYGGPGDRSFTVVQAPGAHLSPPLDLSVIGVEVRGVEGRWSDARGELEWVEGDDLIGLRSASLSLDELLTVADAMGPA